MKRNIFLAATASLLLLFSTSCSDYLDVNHDPNVLEEIPDADVLLPSAEMTIANQLMGWDFGFGGGYWAEYWTQNYTASQFKSLCEYQAQDFEVAYNDLTANSLTDLKRIKDLTKDDKDKQGSYMVAEALSIFAWQIVTDVWGDVPYSEALKGSEGISAPKFDKGKDIYADLLSRVNNLLAMDWNSATLNGKYDYVYGGNLAKWKLFVNSLKLKLMLRLSETPDYNNQAVLDYVKSNEFLTESAKISGSVWSDNQEGKRHPMREFQQGGANYLSSNVIACKNFIDYLNFNGDPRLSSLFTVASGTTYKGAFFGDFESTEDSDDNGTADSKEKYSTASFAANMDLMFMSDWEVAFYISEVYARGGDKVNAKKYYEAGVKASLAQHGFANAEIIEADGYAKWTDGTVEEEIKEICMQKWVANANYQHIESFLERNRTKYPSVNTVDIKSDRKGTSANFPAGYLTISVKGRALLNGNLPASPTYPSSILTRNNNAPVQKTDVREKVWWNVKNGL